MNSPSRKSEPTGSACSQPAWKMSLSQSILLAEIMLPKSVTCFFTIAYTFSKLNTDLKFDMSGCYVGKLLGFSSGIWRRVVWQKFTDVSKVRVNSSSTLKKTAAQSSATSVNSYQAIRRHIPEEVNIMDISCSKLNCNYYSSELNTLDQVGTHEKHECQRKFLTVMRAAHNVTLPLRGPEVNCIICVNYALLTFVEKHICS